MRKYKALDTVRLYAGTVFLAEDQYKRRTGSLKKMKNGAYSIEKPVEFKAGEIIGFHSVPKPCRVLLEPVKKAAKVIDDPE